jgi:hypothetical protein
MAQTMKLAPDSRVQVSTLYSAGQVARILGIAHNTANRLVDQRVIAGFRVPGGRPDRRVTHGALMNFIRAYPQYKYALSNVIGDNPADDFPEGTEPAPALTRATFPAPPRSPEGRPKSVRRGRIPQAQRYSLKEIGFLLGLHRRSVWSSVRSGVLPASRAPATGPAPWRWLVMHEALVAFIKRYPAFEYALDRLQGDDSSRAFPSPVPPVRPRNEPPVAATMVADGKSFGESPTGP